MFRKLYDAIARHETCVHVSYYNSREWWVGKDLERRGRRLFQGTIPAISCTDWEKSRKLSVNMASVSVEIRACYLQNANPRR
jgi:hypothetical protein